MKVLHCVNRTAIVVLFLIGQYTAGYAQNTKSTSLPTLVSFVAPAYPSLANDARMEGTTVTHVRIGKDGRVIEAKTVSAHPIFAKYVLDALKQWRFAPSENEHELDVTCRFEFYAPHKCFGTDGKPISPETIVSATLPTNVLVQTTEKCITITTSDPIAR